MGPALRLCLVLESSARAGAHWRSGSMMRQLVEPILALVEAAQGGCELAVVWFGGPAAVESGLGWWADVAQFRHALLDGLDFVGGGCQPVALAEALAEAAALFAGAPGGSVGGASPACPQHCLVCFSSDPSTHPVPWPFAEDCSLAKLPGLATSAELCHALRRRGVLLSLAGPNLLNSTQQRWHLSNVLSDVPLSLDNAHWERLKRQQGPDSMQQQLMRVVATLPAGGGVVALPFWPQALEALQQQSGAKLLGAVGAPLSLRTAGSLPSDGASLEAASLTDKSAAKRLKTAGSVPSAANPPASAPPGAAAPAAPAAPAAAAAAAAPPMGPPGAGPAAAAAAAPLKGVAAPSPEAPPTVQWTPPTAALAQQATPPIDQSPGGFWEVLNAEILSPDVEGFGGAPPAAQTLAYQPQEPAVPGLPLPPLPPMQQVQQQAQAAQAAAAAQAGGLPQAMAHPAQQQAPMLQQAQQPMAVAQPTAGMPGVPGSGVTNGGPQLQGLPAGGGAVPAGAPTGTGKYVLIHTASVVVDPKITQKAALILGTAQVLATQQDAPALLAMSWPQELHVTRMVPLSSAQQALRSKPGCRQTLLRIKFASAEAEVFPARLLERGAVGLVSVFPSAHGLLLAQRHPASQQLVLHLVLMPTSRPA